CLVGVFLLLKRMVLFGDGFSHIAFGGVALGLFLSYFFNFDPYLVAILFSLFSSIGIFLLKEKFKIKNDIALGVFFSLAVALGTIIISLGGGFYSDLHSYLFGNILLLEWQDVILALLICCVLFLFLYLFGSQMLFATIDNIGAKVAGIHTSKFDLAFLSLSAILVVLSIRIVGILLAASFLILPSATAMIVARSFKQMVLFSILFSIFAVVVGLALSYIFDISSGGSIVLISILLFFLISFFTKN
ncbi:MAG: metal ABC transporter permease, partial [Candidatus Anstonellaceae archaeon]